MKARKKPVVVDAVKFEGFHSFTGQAIFSDRPKWLTEAFGNKVIFFGKPNTLTIYTLEGNMVANVGDYIIRGVQGEFYPCKPDIFEETYDLVNDDDVKNVDYSDYGFLWNEPEKVLIINGQKEENVVKAVITIAPCQVIKVELEKLILEPNIGVIDKVNVETKGVWPLAENITTGTIDENTVNDAVKALNLKSYNAGIADLIL